MALHMETGSDMNLGPSLLTYVISTFVWSFNSYSYSYEKPNKNVEIDENC